MTEQRFQAPPLPPRAPSFGVPPTPSTAQPQAQSSAAAPVENKTELPADNFAASFKLPVTIYKTKVLGGILAATAVVGILFGALLFGGSGDSPAKPQGLAGVVPNRDVSKDLTRCGMVPETVACVAYFVNHTRNDKLAEEFFDEAVHQTGRAKYRINIDNPHYAKTRIPPGYIAQIRIPTLN